MSLSNPRVSVGGRLGLSTVLSVANGLALGDFSGDARRVYLTLTRQQPKDNSCTLCNDSRRMLSKSDTIILGEWLRCSYKRHPRL